MRYCERNFIGKLVCVSSTVIEMNDVHFKNVRSLFENNDKEGLLALSTKYFKQIHSAKFLSVSDLLARMQGNFLGRNHQAEMQFPRCLFQETKKCMAIR